jgi:hypothetical protein
MFKINKGYRSIKQKTPALSRAVLCIAAIVLGAALTPAQETGGAPEASLNIHFGDHKKNPSRQFRSSATNSYNDSDELKVTRVSSTLIERKSRFDLIEKEPELEKIDFGDPHFDDRDFDDPRPKFDDDDPDASQTESRDKFHWKPALIQSGIFLGIQHAARLSQKKTRRELDGPFFADWGASVKNLRGWKDGDNFFINYIAHPLQGGLTGRIFVNNSDRAKRQEFGKSKQYWESRFKAMAWSAVWSTQFEIGLFSEANIGNVGQHLKKGYSEMSYGDLVVTPVVGTGVVVGEDAIDKYILKNWLERKAGKLNTRIKILRSLLTPTTSVSNLLRGKAPWKRDDR